MMRNKLFWVTSTVLIICFNISFSGFAQKNVTVKNDTNTVNQLLERAKNFTKLKKADSAEAYFVKAGKLALELNVPKTALKYFTEYTNFLFLQSRYNDALEVARKQLILSLKIKDYRRAANAYNNMAVQYRLMGNLKQASEYLLRALKIAESSGDLLGQKKFNNNLSSLFLDLNDKKNGLLYAQKCYAIALKLNDSLEIATALSNLAISERMNNRMDLAIQHLTFQGEIATKFNLNDLLIEVYINLGDIYNGKKDFKKALDTYNKANELLKKSPSKDNEIYILHGLANSYYNLNQYAKANYFIDKTLPIAINYMAKNDLKEVYFSASEIAEKLNDPKKALIYWKKYSKLNDSILNESTQQSIHDAEIKYQTSVKEKALAQQKLQLTGKNYEIQKKDRQILISIIVILFLLSISTIVYLFFKAKNQAIQLSLLKSQIHPHFLFNTLNNLYALSLNKSDDSPEVVMGLSLILRYILYECNSKKVSLNKEIEIIERYISLEKIRYSNRLEISLDLKGNLKNHEIAPLLILPLVENAFKHGISKLSEEGWIKIETNVKENEFVFKISNNTPTQEESKLKASKFGNIGLQNIKKRLKILYPNKHEFKIINEDEVFMVIMEIKL